MTFWKSPSFKALQQAWYQRLRDDGFEDIEELVGDEMMLRESSLPHRSAEDNVRQAYGREEYYLRLSQKVHEGGFRNDVDRVILTAYCDGKKASEICEDLRQRGTPRHRHAIRFIVRRYEVMWELRAWKPSQLGKKVS